MRSILSSEYSRQYYLGKDDAVRLGSFKKGADPGENYLQAYCHFPKNTKGPFLDVGCGRGELVIYLARQGKRAWGIDYSPAAIQIAEEILKSEKKSVRGLASFRVADCTRLPFKDRTFQGVFLLDVAEHLTPKQLGLVLGEARRVLKNKGILIIKTPNYYFEKMIKLFLAATYHGVRVFLRPRSLLEMISAESVSSLHINYLTGFGARNYLKNIGLRARVEYVRPKEKADFEKYMYYREEWKRKLFYPLAWLAFKTPLKAFLAPTFWLVAEK